MFEIIFLFGLIVLLGFFSRWLFENTKVPEPLILLVFGFILGPLGLLNFFSISNLDLVQFKEALPVVGAIALVSIVFEASLRLKVKDFPKDFFYSLLFSVLNLGLCVVLLTALVRFVFGWSPINSFILGSILGAISSYSSYSILPFVKTTNSLRSALYFESTLSTIFVCVLTLGIMKYSSLPFSNQNSFASILFSLFSVSFIFGLFLSLCLLFLLLHFNINRFGRLVLFSVVLIIYFVDFVIFGGVGVISVALIGFVLANSELFLKLLGKPNFSFDNSLTSFQSEISIFVNTFFFVYLGMIFDLSQISTLAIFFVISIVLVMLFSRFLVAFVLKNFVKSQKHEDFLRVVFIPRDLLSAVLASFVFIYSPSSSFIIDTIILAIVFSTIFTSVALFYYEKIFKDSFLFKKEIQLVDGRKVLIRTFTKDDVGKLKNFLNKLVEEGAYIAIDQRLDTEDEREMVNDMILRMNRKELIVWVGVHDNRIIAKVSAEKMSGRERDNVSLSFYVDKDFRGVGLGTILIRLIVNEALKTFDPHNLYLTVYSDNTKAIKLYEREGFVKCGVLPGWVKHNNKYLNRVYMVYKPKKEKALENS
ncbi:MAG: GNAT family N-acetyltransferase [Candidatus Diapherotrites archaeon]